MSEHSICFIPADPHWVPDRAAQDAAVNFVRAQWPAVSMVIPEVSGQVALIDCGENFEGIFCPGCDVPIGVDYWQELMDRDYSERDGFMLASQPMPCCQVSATLNDLNYRWPMGFSRFVLRTADTGCAEELLAGLEAILGVRLRIIHQMY